MDYFHTSKGDTRIVSLDRVVDDGEWAGSRTRLLDDTNLGAYRVEVIDRATQQVIYSRGFASIFGEWETVPASQDGVADVPRLGADALATPARPGGHEATAADQSFTELWSDDGGSQVAVREPRRADAGGDGDRRCWTRARPATRSTCSSSATATRARRPTACSPTPVG